MPIALDLRGHGVGPRADLAQTRMDDYADDVRRAVLSLSQPPIVLGWSMGGLVAMMVLVTAAVIAVSDTLPSATCVKVNAHALARYAALCQEQGVVPIVEPEVLMDGAHTIERCEDVTGHVLHNVFNALFDQKVSLEGMLLKPNMIISGIKCAKQASVKEVALATVRYLRRHVPAAVPGIVFLSGGQNHLVATAHLSAINQIEEPRPWTLSFSYGRALQDEALRAWRGKSENLKAGQRAFYHRAKCDSAAALGKYTESMESEPAAA